MSESNLQAQCIELLTRLGHWAIRVNSGRVPTRGGWFSGAEAGTPDTICMFRGGGFAWFEIKDGVKGDKRTKGETLAAQTAWREKARARGVRVAKIRSLDELIEKVKEWE